MSAEIGFNASIGEFTREQVYEFSLFRNLADTNPTTITLDDFAEMVSGGEWYHEVSNVREAKDKDARNAAKRLLPAVTISGIFEGGHQAAQLRKHSGLICMDFDIDANPFLDGRVDEFRDTLKADQFSIFAMKSVSGNGIAVLCRIEPERHAEAFDALSEWYRQTYGLKADRSCRDVCRLRFSTWDSEAQLNANARLFKRYSLAGSLPQQQESFTGLPPLVANDVGNATQRLSRERKQEIADALGSVSPDSRDTWLMVGQAIHSECPAQDGYNLWREWSELNDTSSKFSEPDCFRVWKSFRRTGINIETLFKLAYVSGWQGPPPLPVTELPTVQGDAWLVQQEAERKPLLVDLIDEGEMSECIAPSKCRKSFFTLQLAMCIAAGRKFLSFEVHRKARVLLVNMEITPEWQHRRMIRMAKALNIDKNEIIDLHFANTRGLNVANMPDAIIQTCKILNPALVIVDPLYFLHDGDENAAKDMMPVVREFQRMMKETGAAMIIVHHDAKGKAGDRNIRDRGAGSSVFGRACDSRIVLTPHADGDDKICVETMARNFPPREGFVCKFDGSFSIDSDSDFIPESSKTVTRNKDEKATLEFSELAAQARGYLLDDIMRLGDFVDRVLRGAMGLGVNKASRLSKYMKKEQVYLTTKQIDGGYYISANDKLIRQKNEEIDRLKNSVLKI